MKKQFLNMQRFWSIVKKEFIHIKRDKASFAIALVMPVMMMLLFGYAVNTELENIKTAVLDMNNTEESRDLVKSFENTKYFTVSDKVNSIEEIQEKMDKGQIHAAIIIPSDYSKKLLNMENPAVELMIDGSDPTTARTAFSSGVLVGEKKALSITQKLNEKTAARIKTGGIDIRTKVLYNPDLNNRNFTIPGLIGLIMQNITVLLTAFTLVRERERGNIELLIVSPLKSQEIILGKLMPYIIIGFLDFLLSLGLGIWWFNVPLNGSLGLLLFLGTGFVICSLAIGVLISTIAKTQLQAMQMTIIIILPSVLLSGFIFPREAMPVVIQWLGYLMPLTYFLDILRGIITKGVGIIYLLKDVILLSSLGMILLVISIMRFRAKLD